MPELPLLEAFRRCGPPVGDPVEDQLRRSANEVLYAHLQHLVAGRPALEDVPGTVLLRLVQGGPRPDCRYTSDDEIDFYLRRAVHNGEIDGHRALRRTDALDDVYAGGDVPAATRVAADAVDLSRAKHALARAVECLFGEVTAACSASVRHEIAIRRSVAEGRRSFDDCVLDASGSVNVRTRNAFYQRQSRAMSELARVLADHLAGCPVDPWQASALEIVFRALKDAEADWPVREGA